MAKSNRLQLRDIRLVCKIVEECRDLWADPDSWRLRLVEGAAKLTGMAVGHYGEFSVGADGQPSRTLCLADTGWRDESAHRAYQVAAKVHPNHFDFFPGSVRFVDSLARGEQVVLLREELIPKREWYRSRVYNEFRLGSYTDDHAISIIQRGKGAYAHLNVNQDIAESRPTERTKRQLALLHRWINPLIGVELATEQQNCLHGLTPAQRATLKLLLSGDSEKLIAAQLGVRPATAHEYVGKIYRHFKVCSRAELMAYFIRRQPKPNAPEYGKG